MRKKRVTITAIVTAALVLGGGGAAFAYFSAIGSGSGKAQTGTSTDFTIASSTAGSGLTPGGLPQAISFTVTNPGTGSQKLTNVAITIAMIDGSPWTPTVNCSALDYTISDIAFTVGQIAGSGTALGTAKIRMNNLDTNQDGCKGAEVPLYFFAS